jgi:flagellar basal body-associated protein FliL
MVRDCCVSENKETEDKGVKGGKMNRKIILWIIIAILAIAVLYVVFNVSSGTGQAVQSAGQAAGNLRGMVGGC